MSTGFFVIADIHGHLMKQLAVQDTVSKAHPEFKSPFGLAEGWELVQTGDKNDRGPDSYAVAEYYRVLELQYPGQVHCLMGNHELMMLDAAMHRPHGDIFWLPGNGGKQTLESYSRQTKFYGKGSLGNSLSKTGHGHWIKGHMLFLETEEYFFCHAPQAKEIYRNTPPGFDFRCNLQGLVWGASENLYSIPEEKWVEPNLIPIEENGNFQDKYKTCVYGHIHGIQFKEVLKTYRPATHDAPEYKIKGYEIIVPGVRRYGNSILLDTGCGCADEGYLSCLELPSMTVYDSLGRVYKLDDPRTPEAQYVIPSWMEPQE